MKSIILLTISLFCLTAKAQDTLYFSSGEIQLVQLISVNEKLGLIKYSLDGKTQIRSISSLKSYSNNAKVTNENWNLETSTSDPQPSAVQQNHSSSPSPSFSSEDPSKYSYSKFSIGANLLSPIQYGAGTFGIASNYNQSFYVQYNVSDKLGFRIPVRIGFNRLKDTVFAQTNGPSWKHDRDLIGEGGVELLLMKDDNRKMNPYLMPGLYFGGNRGVIDIPGSTWEVDRYCPSPIHFYFRVGLTGGLQFNISKYIQINTELGFNYNNAFVTYYSSWSNPGLINEYERRRLGTHAAVNIVYRFGGKLRE